MAKDHKQAPGDLQKHVKHLSDLQRGAGRKVAAAVQGHRGDSTVSVAASGKGAQVTVSGPDAAEHRAAVHKDARAALRKGQ